MVVIEELAAARTRGHAQPSYRKSAAKILAGAREVATVFLGRKRCGLLRVRGVLEDTREPGARVAARWLLALKRRPVTVRGGLYRPSPLTESDDSRLTVRDSRPVLLGKFVTVPVTVVTVVGGYCHGTSAPILSTR